MVTTPNYDLDVDTTLGGNNASDYIIPSQKAIKVYVDNNTGSTVDQTFDPTSQAAQSGVAIEGELSTNYVKTENNNAFIDNGGTYVNCGYEDDDYFAELYIDDSRAYLAFNDTQNDYHSEVTVRPEGIVLSYNYQGVAIVDSSNNDDVTLTVSNNNLAVNGSEVALQSDIPDISTKQDTLVSGTNIKTVNNTSLLGSGNIDTTQIFVATYGTTTLSEITTAINNGKTIFVKNSNSDFCPLIRNNGTSCVFSQVYSVDMDYDNYIMYYVVDSNNDWNNYIFPILDQNLSNLSATGKEVIDGQWVDINQQIISSTTSLNGSTYLTYRVDLPNDGHKYEVMFRGSCFSASTTGNSCYLAIVGNEDVMSRYVCQARSGTATNYVGAGTVICRLSYVASGSKNLTVQRSSSWNGSTGELRAIAYRRIGTNS